MAGPVRTDAVSDLIGREAESGLIAVVVDRLPAGGGALVLRGEPGIGKSALLHLARERAGAAGVRTLTTVGVESEAEFAFAGLHQLLRPVLEHAVRLPAAQRRALDTAFGAGEEVEPDSFRVALATFQLLCEAAETGPIVLIVDDAHWLDRPTLGALAFVARRLDSEPLAMVAAVRAGRATALDDARLPTLDVERLSAPTAAELLDGRAAELHPVLRARVLAEAAGNPLALVELARTAPASTTRLASAPPTLTTRLEQAFGRQLDDLPAETRSALLAAALDSRASLGEIVRASAAPVAALYPAVEARLVQIEDGAVRFRHPLIRAAVRQSASAGQVLAMYAALAEAVADPERSMWHRAMAAEGPDELIASALEEHARAARGRGAVTVAGAALERAAALTADLRKKSRLLVAAAEIAHELGLADVVRRVLREAEPLDLAVLEAARLAWLRQVVSGDVWVESGATRRFVEIAQQMRNGGDADLALRSLVPIAHRCWWTRTRTTTRQYLVDAAMGMGLGNGDPRVLAVIALAHPEMTGPSVLSRVARLSLGEVTDAVAAMHVGIAAEKAGDFQIGARFLARAVEGLREQVRLGLLTQALVHFAWVAIPAGEWSAATAAAQEAAALARDTRQPQYGLTGELVGALVTALRGTAPDIESVLAQPEQAVLRMEGGPLLATAHLARGAATLGEGRHEEAFRHLWPVFDETGPTFHRFMRWPALLDLVEAAAASGHAARVAGAIAELEAIAARSEPPILSLSLACARPLLAADEQAEGLFVAALAHDLAGYPFLGARTRFSFGRWLRRQRRTAESRAPLRESITLFDALGATVWSRRARQELRATGETIGPRALDLRDRLTAQELQIAQLAADGLSNREIGERLFLSPRTIGGHLYRTFPKLEITARAQLRDALKRVG
jgi:DNA-binding CsgD family transcriptional regulator